MVVAVLVATSFVACLCVAFFLECGHFVEILEKIYRVISGVHCIHRMVFHCLCELSLWLLLLILLYCESINDI